MKTILVVDDKLSLVRMLEDYLNAEGYQVLMADNGRNALFTARHNKPDLILLDIMMPEMDGYDFIRTFRKESNIPIIMLTALNFNENAIMGLELGADDYVTKPFDLELLSARIHAVLRRYEKGQGLINVVRLGKLELDLASQQVAKNGEPINLTASEYKLFQYFMENPDRVFTRTEFLSQIEYMDQNSTERTIDVHVRKLRQKIEDDPAKPSYLETIFGFGYRLNRRLGLR